MCFYLFLSCAGAPSISTYTGADANPVVPAAEAASIVSADKEQRAELEQQVADMVKMSNVQTARTLAVEHFLSDRVAAEHGDAPKGWKQPSLETYLDKEAPASFIPVEVKP